MILTVLFLGTFLFALFSAYLIQAKAAKYSLVDVPEARSSHRHIIPTGGGIAIVISFVPMLYYFYSQLLLSQKDLSVLMIGGLLIAAIGLWDDFKYLSVKIRFLVQSISVLCVIAWIGPIPKLDLGFCSLSLGWMSYGFTFLGLVWLLNLFNFMDGIDGLAAMEAIFVSLSSSYLLWNSGLFNYMWVFFFLAASVAGFLVFNWSPASLFMGDIGSNFLGYLFGFLIVICGIYSKAFIWPWIILLGIFIIDATVTLIKRIQNGKIFYQAHCSHAYQHLAKQWGSHKKVVLAVLMINLCWLLPWSLIAYHYPSFGFMVTLIALSPLVWLSLRLKAGLE